MTWKSHGTNEKICELKTHSTKLDVFLRATMHFHPKQLRICSPNPKFKGIRIHLKIGFKIWSVECAYYKCVKGSQKQWHTLVRETTVVLIICLYRNEGENRHITFANTLFLDFLTEGLRLCCRFYSSVPISSLPFTRPRWGVGQFIFHPRVSSNTSDAVLQVSGHRTGLTTTNFLERDIMYNCLLVHFNDNCLLYQCQFGTRNQRLA